MQGTSLPPSAASLFSHVTAEKTAVYRLIMEAFATAKRQFRLHLRPDEVLLEAHWPAERPALEEVQQALAPSEQTLLKLAAEREARDAAPGDTESQAESAASRLASWRERWAGFKRWFLAEGVGDRPKLTRRVNFAWNPTPYPSVAGRSSGSALN